MTEYRLSNALRTKYKEHYFVYVFLTAGITLLYFFYGLGNHLNISTPATLEEPEIVVLLGGGWKFREITASELARSRAPKRILLTGVMRWDTSGIPISYPSYDYLISTGIDSQHIILNGDAKNTWQEIQWVKDVMMKAAWKTAVIVTDPPHLRRLDWVCRKILGKAGFQYRLKATRPDWWHAGLWWRNFISARFVTLELVKLIYYKFRYT